MRSLRRLTFVLVAAAIAGACGGGTGSRGPLTLDVDATDIGRKIFHVRLKIPVSSGPLTLVYPKWIPGEHAPTGPITDLVGLQTTVAGKPVEWRRDDVDMYAFHVTVPPQATELTVTFDFLSAIGTAGFTSAASATPHLAIVTWNQLVLYPEGARTDDVQVEASLRLPAGWKYGTSLKKVDSVDGGDVFAPVSLTSLVDSPVLAGEYFQVVPLDSSARSIEIDMAADSEAALKVSPELLGQLKQLVAEADALYGARHFDTYHFLLTLSDHVAHFGLEHHQSNDTRLAEQAVVTHLPTLFVLSHEFMHSWNGKYRRPAGLATADFQAPMKGELLWVYEGLTHYLGNLLAARSGLWTEEFFREQLAASAAYLDTLPGRAWRPLVDTTVAAQLLYSAPAEWSAYRRGVDFYDEGWLIWLDADTKIRELTQGQKSLDDFCRKFHGGESGSPAVKPYTFDDVVAAMNEVAANDWRTFFTDRVTKTGSHAPLEGVARSGWQIVYNDTRNAAQVFGESGDHKSTEAGYSIGVRVGEGGKLLDVIPGLPGFAAGLGPGMKLLKVNGKAYSPDVLRQAILADAIARSPMVLDIENTGVTKTITVNYHDGLREPHLQRTSSGTDVLHEIVKPHAGGGGK